MAAPTLSRFTRAYEYGISADRLNTMKQTADTIANLRAFVGIIGQTVELRGLNAVSDGGQGDYIWSTASGLVDDGVNVIIPVGVDASNPNTGTGGWVKNPQVGGYTGGALDASVTALGTNQATAYVIKKKLTIFSTVATGTGAVLPVTIAGDDYEIINGGANALLLYPPGTGQVNLGGSSVGLSMAAGSRRRAFYNTATDIRAY